ncbi:hypothetical protein FGO68_gene6963 [Halteria grandinella]|uniref:Uncharacterized protein n=1 Tax=Halteria grandinella TaxID=5974 RepID=A0A8J8NPP7_HALGN|nr:hypothetical protein FGO68_gene6963 [Halteria grandinella]
MCIMLANLASFDCQLQTYIGSPVSKIVCFSVITHFNYHQLCSAQQKAPVYRNIEEAYYKFPNIQKQESNKSKGGLQYLPA